MKVKKLIKQLNECDKEQEVYISKDEEGNEFKPINEVCKASGEEDNNRGVIEGYIIYPYG